MAENDHYLAKEFYELVRTDPAIFDFLQAGSLDGIWYWDLQNPETEWMSGRFWETFGYDPATMPHRADAWQDMIHPEDLEIALENFNAHCADSNHPYDQVVRYKHRDGSTVWVRCRGIVIRDDDGNPVRMLGAHNEVTMLKRAEEKLGKAVDRLAASNRNLEQFAAVASHDLQAPLQTITNFLTLLQFSADDRLTEKELDYIRRATNAAQRQSEMIRALLDWSRVQMHDLKRVQVDTSALVAEVLSGLQSTLEAEGGEVLVGALPTVEADPDLLRRVFQNLVGNALKFRSEAPPQIHIEAEDAEGGWTFRVQDNGIGFAPEYAERIFDFGERLHGRGEYGGDGIGLAVCQRVIEDHGGRIWAESSAPGATFVFRLPA